MPFIAIIVGIPPIARWAKLPTVTGLLLFGVILGIDKVVS